MERTESEKDPMTYVLRTIRRGTRRPGRGRLKKNTAFVNECIRKSPDPPHGLFTYKRQKLWIYCVSSVGMVIFVGLVFHKWNATV